MRSRKWLGIPVSAVGWLFFVRWFVIAGFAIAMLVGGGYSIAILGQRFGLNTGGGYPFIGEPNRSESAKLKQLNELVAK